MQQIFLKVNISDPKVNGKNSGKEPIKYFFHPGNPGKRPKIIGTSRFSI
jgi:hypothetical protein